MSRWTVVFSILSVACGSSGGSVTPDAGSDANMDAGSDAGVDAGSDAGSDSGSDAGSDSGSDAGSDTGCVATGDEVCDGLDNDCLGGIDDGLDCARWEGSGADGDLDVSDEQTLDPLNFGLVSVDGVALTVDAAATELEPGTEVLIINLRGDEADADSVGHYETRFVDSVDTDVITLRNELSNTYGVGGANEDFTGQTVVVMRVPHFATLTVGASGTLTTSPFDGDRGGVLFFRAQSLEVVAGGEIDLSTRGYRGGQVAPNGEMGVTGESLGGMPVRQTPPPTNHGGGLGGLSDCDIFNCTTQDIGAGGGGASYASSGTAGMNNGALHEGGAAGSTYGEPTLSDLFLGSGGGGGAGGVSGPAGGSEPGDGGGLLVAHTNSLSVAGSVLSDGRTGSQNNNCVGPRGSGGGGAGSGGTIWLTATTMTLAADTIRALGGPAQCQGGGIGGEGRIRLDFATLNGMTMDAASAAANSAADPDPGMLGEL